MLFAQAPPCARDDRNAAFEFDAHVFFLGLNACEWVTGPNSTIC
jgi:hypothetical protein